MMGDFNHGKHIGCWRKYFDLRCMKCQEAVVCWITIGVIVFSFHQVLWPRPEPETFGIEASVTFGSMHEISSFN